MRLRGVARLDRDERLPCVARLEREERLPCVARPDREERPSVARLRERGAVDRSSVRLRVVRESERASRVALRPTRPLPVVRTWLSERDERERASVPFPPRRVRVALRPTRLDSVRSDSVRVLRALRLEPSREVLPADERVAVLDRPTRPDDEERVRVVVRAEDC